MIILDYFLIYGVPDRQASLHRTFTVWVKYFKFFEYSYVTYCRKVFHSLSIIFPGFKTFQKISKTIIHRKSAKNAQKQGFDHVCEITPFKTQLRHFSSCSLKNSIVVIGVGGWCGEGWNKNKIMICIFRRLIFNYRQLYNIIEITILRYFYRATIKKMLYLLKVSFWQSVSKY